MKSRVLVGGVVAVAFLLFPAAFAMPVLAGGNKVAYTASIADLGQGVWGGVALFADGTVEGKVAFSAGDGTIIFTLTGTSWSDVVPGVSLDICFSVNEIKGSSGFPPAFCVAALFGPVLVTGTPLFLDLDGDGKADQIVRVTPAN